jgi:hypothetical protein
MTRALAITNLILQVLLIVSTLAAVCLARRRRLKRHCLVMRVTVGVEVVLIAALMAPSLAAYLRNWNGWSWFTAEIVIHHILGVIAVLLFIFFNLVTTRVVSIRWRLRPFMWTAFALWIVVLAMGIHLYWYIWR